MLKGCVPGFTMSEAVTSSRSEGQWIPRVTRTPKDLGLQEEASRRAGLMQTAELGG